MTIDRRDRAAARTRDKARGLPLPARLLLVLAALLLVASACGSSDDSESATVSDAGSDEAADFDTEASGEDSDGSSDEGGEVAAGQAAAPDTSVEFDREEAAADDEATEDAADSDAGSDQATPSQDPQGEVEDGESPLGAGGANVTPTAADLGRKLIFTAFLNVEVDDVAVASAEATSIIEGMGGFLFGQQTEGGAEAVSVLTFKVLPTDFNRALAQLGTVGELRNQNVSTDDVTERIVDLESRILVAELGVDRLRAALEGAPTLEDYAEIERLLLDRESNLEVMRGQLRTLQDRVDLATITLTLTQDRVENGIDLRVSTYNQHDGGKSCTNQDSRSVEADSDLTVCFDIVNVGDQTLTQISLTDTVLEIDDETELIPVLGTLDELAPGQSALVAYEINPERSLRLRTRVIAIPTDGISPEQAGPSVSTEANFDVQVFEPDRNPGFGDGFSTAVEILQGLWIGLTVAIGFLLPLLILLPFLWLGWLGIRALRARMPQRPQRPSSAPGGGIAPPPPRPAPVAQSSGPASGSAPPGTAAATEAPTAGGTTTLAEPPPPDPADPAEPPPPPNPGNGQ